MSVSDFRSIADEISSDIACGHLEAGYRLLPQREFAYSRGIAVSTAGRVYAELVRRGLVAGEVGRGTFVVDRRCRSDPPLVEPSSLPIDLEMVVSIPSECVESFEAGLATWIKTKGRNAALSPALAAGTPELRDSAASIVSRRSWSPNPADILFSGNGKQAIAATFSALARPGARIGVESITYPVIKSISDRLGVSLVPLALDGEGVMPEAIEEAHGRKKLSAVYLQPALHNPLGISMDQQRRSDVAALLDRLDVFAIEDGIYSFLSPEQSPLAALAPNRVIFIDSLSKRVAPGTTLGMIVAPPPLVPDIAVSLRSGGWLAHGLSMSVAGHLMESGVVDDLVRQKQADARARQALAHQILGSSGLLGDYRAYHSWLPLPDTMRVEEYVSRAREHGIAISAGSSFAIGFGRSPAGVRLALAAPSLDELSSALVKLKALL